MGKGQINILMSGNILCQYNNNLFIQQSEKIYLYDIEKKEKELLIVFPWRNYHKWMAKFRLTERLLRLNIRSAQLFGDNLIFSQNGYIYTYNLVARELSRVIQHRKGMRAPLKYSIIDGVKGFEKQICFGEYFTDEELREVRIIRSLDGKNWETVYSFPEGAIRHIHGIYADSYDNRVYILTGDKDEESAIWVAKDDFSSVDLLVGGKQCFRTCQMWVRPDCIIWATDSEYEQNYLYKMKKHEKDTLSVIASLPGSVIYGNTSENKFVFSTTVEPNKGGILTSDSVIYCLNNEFELSELISDKKDILSSRYFQYGFANILINKNNIWIGYTATKKYDNKIIEIDIEV